ncbi:hypothetical protein [Roseicella aerolata]|uniref:Uncharacterized protein n=1 Tax=Roseicella aerolata TaxID=2883479 RepID=A0A9X1II34_9PROT|nr:hypothetical protein [Roseicella aerolata]MCB4825015.1 hypothetical protein [Roseicella aerolata]
MQTATGTVLAVQESRFRLLTEDGRGLLFLLASDTPLEPQDLPALANRRVRVRYTQGEQMLAGIAQDIQFLDRPETRS